MSKLLTILFTFFFCSVGFADICNMKENTGLFTLEQSKEVLFYVERVEGAQDLYIVSVVKEFKLNEGKLPDGIKSEDCLNNYDKSLKRYIAYLPSIHSVSRNDQGTNSVSSFTLRQGIAGSEAGQSYLVVAKNTANFCSKKLLNPSYNRGQNNRYIDISFMSLVEESK